eukprot:CAMPEP_0206412496 /NCGR_PEP_ID=MMETSP0294-20121207/34048_1 /ASSEMBLY_ACC=CAM_ASM_000327 /TAXON_ID=39354 /ORGANISM="Heterosigma akashiwo, Strain CCMP2393" /LENGTH=54 /DNA_ID=CAMNT_0053873695 /DNA_START=178 /DNA_END=342 /DNA_ORIENTATION=-
MAQKHPAKTFSVPLKIDPAAEKRPAAPTPAASAAMPAGWAASRTGRAPRTGWAP